MAKLPNPPGRELLRSIGPEIAALPARTLLFRIYFWGGEYPGQWNEFRSFGPLASARFDHHPEPTGAHPEHGILYAAPEIKTCVAEVFQETRHVDTRQREPWLVGFSLGNEIPLLNLTEDWPTRAGASMNINSGPRPKCRRWSRLVYEAYPQQVAGLLYASSMHANREAVALYERAAQSMPANPTMHIPLSHPGLLGALEETAGQLGYDLS